MTDEDDVIRRAVRELVDAAPAPKAMQGPVQVGSRRWLVVAAAGFVGLAGLAVLWALTGESSLVTSDTTQPTVLDTLPPPDTAPPSSVAEPEPATTQSPSSAPDVSDPWSWTIEEPPLADRVEELVVALPDSIFVWGGFVPEHADGSVPPFTDGAIVDLTTGVWSPVSAGPLAGGRASGVWSGSEVVVANREMVAAYDPVLDAWRDLDVPVELPAGLAPGETHYLTRFGGDVVVPFAGLVWDVDQEVWHDITPAPSLLGFPRSAEIGGRLIVAGAPTGSPTNPMAFAYDSGSDEWSELPAPGWQVYDGDAIGFVGDRLVVVSSSMGTAGALDLVSFEWRALPPFPQSRNCYGELEPIDETEFVVLLCSQHAALTFGVDQWFLFDPPSTSRTFGLVAVDDGLVVDGSLLDPTSPDWARSPLVGPLTIAGVTIDRTVEPAAVAVDTRGAPRVDLTAIDCALAVSDGDYLDQRTVAQAQQDAATGAAQVTFFNQFGGYVLSCPNPDAYAAAFDAMIIRGERGQARESDALLDPPLPAAATPDDMVETVLHVVQANETRLGRDSRIGLSAPLGDPPSFLVDVYFDDGAIEGETFVITLRETTEGWVIDNTTVQTICTRTPRTDTPATCR
jgi:hypothetical protein